MSLERVPVTNGSDRHLQVAIDGGTVISAFFPANGTIDRHAHDYPIFAVMMRGAFDLEVGRRRFDCDTTTVLIEPSGEPHGNRMHDQGAQVLVIQAETIAGKRWAAFDRLLGQVAVWRSARIAEIAQRAAAEVTRPDPFSRLSVDAYAVEMLVTAGRAEERKTHDAPPPWLARITELLHDEPANTRTVRTLAAEAGVSQGRLVRAFRRHYGSSIGRYARAARLAWAVTRLAESDDPIALIAANAGFADQSHLTRVMRRALGRTPATLRAHRLHSIEAEAG
jgi:AraC family transcriptional regulator